VLLYAQAFVSGLVSAGVLTLIAVGFSLQWRSLRIVNLAHFSLVLLAAYVTYGLSTWSGLDPFLTLVVVVPVFAVAAMAVQWVYDRFKVSLFNSLLLSFALFILVEGLIRRVWGADFRSIPVDVNPYSVRSIVMFDVAVPIPAFIAFVVAIPVAVGGAAFLRNSYYGKGLRAVAQDREIAVAYGVNYRRVAMLLAGASGAIAGLAGTLVAISTSIFPNGSEAWIGLVFAVVILGGIGSPTGAFVGAILVGVITNFGSTLWGLPAAQLITFLLLIGVLLWRPTGLFARLRT
jgi:branched-chain amino acid transport system permease protein